MTEQRTSARPWYDLAVHEAAVRGWSLSELARRAKVGRPTIYGWRDGTEGKLQPGPVNAVADVLQVPRERALRLAGIITAAVPQENPKDDPIADVVGEDGAEDFRQRVRARRGRDAERIIAQVEAALGREPPQGGGAQRGPSARPAQ